MQRLPSTWLQKKITGKKVNVVGKRIYLGSKQKVRPSKKKEKELTVRLKPSGGASYQESLGSNRSERNTPSLFDFSENECGSDALTGSVDASSFASLGCGNIIIPASDTEYYKQPNTKKNYMKSLPERYNKEIFLNFITTKATFCVLEG